MLLKVKLEQQLLAELSRRNIDLITQWVIDKPEGISILIEFFLKHDNKLAMRAVWVLEKLSERLNEPIADFIPKIIEELPRIKVSGTRRVITKVLMLHAIPEQNEGPVLDFCITMLEAPKEPVAAKANCMTIIFNLLPKYPELKNEIFAIIDDQIPHNKIAFEARYNVLKRTLK